MPVPKKLPVRGESARRKLKKFKRKQKEKAAYVPQDLKPAKRKQFVNSDAAAKAGHDYLPHGLPIEPTDATPGSANKVHILFARVHLGVELWHPDDRKDWSGIDLENLDVEHISPW